jgi:hypothetical protein
VIAVIAVVVVGWVMARWEVVSIVVRWIVVVAGWVVLVVVVVGWNIAG